MTEKKYVFTRKGAARARQAGYDRKEGDIACLGHKPITEGARARTLIAMGYIREVTENDDILGRSDSRTD